MVVPGCNWESNKEFATVDIKFSEPFLVLISALLWRLGEDDGKAIKSEDWAIYL